MSPGKRVLDDLPRVRLGALRRACCIALVALGAAAVLTGCQAAAKQGSGTGTGPGPGVVAGRLVTPSGTPIVGATVVVYQPTSGEAPDTSESSRWPQAKTTEGGAFRVDASRLTDSAGDYWLGAAGQPSKPGVKTTWFFMLKQHLDMSSTLKTGLDLGEIRTRSEPGQ